MIAEDNNIISSFKEDCRDKILVFGVEFDLRDNIILSAPHSLQSIALEVKAFSIFLYETCVMDCQN